MHTGILATREGLLGKVTSSGYIIDRTVPYVALPSVLALGRFLRVINPTLNVAVYAVVLDVGPWNVHDEAYVLGTDRPQAETGTDLYGRQTNKAGIDLGEKIWYRLGLRDNALVNWEFLPEATV